jgi:hypothetical protein
MEKSIKITGDNIQVSDGYHTFDELYEHRIQLYIQLCKCVSIINSQGGFNDTVWRSGFYPDGTEIEGWFLLGIDKGKGSQITYHLPMSKWKETYFAETLDKAPEFDGHTSADVLERLKQL